MKQKKILIIAYYFPPLGGVPVQRTLRFVKYLPLYKWHPTVLTVLNGYDHFHPNDPSLLKDIPRGLEVLRAREIGVIARLIKFIRRGPHTNNTFEKKKRFAGIIRKLRKILYNSLWFPDEKTYWIPGAIFAALRLLSRGEILVIYASGYPWSAFLVGSFLSKLKGVPLILDFRDAWTLNQRGLWNNRFHRFWENKVLLQASRVIFATNLMRKYYIERYPRIDKEKFVTITNGFDCEDFKRFHGSKGRDNERFLITLAGTFNDNVPPLDADQSPYYFLKGLAKLLNEKDISNSIRVRFVGKFGENNKNFVKSLGLEEIIELTGYVPHEKSIEYQIEADLLLLIISECESNFVLTGKLFEYIGARKPILALVPDGEAKDLIMRESLGKTVNPRDIDRIKDTIYEFYEDWKRDNLRFERNDGVLERYEMKSLTKKLVDVIEKTTL